MTVPQKVVYGAPMKEFVGGSFNALVDDYWARRADRSGTKQRQPKANGNSAILPVLVKNDSGADREPGHVLGMSGTILTVVEDAGQVYREPAVVGVTPDATNHSAKFVVCRDHIKYGEIGPGWVMGCGWVRANITDTGHTYLAIKDGEENYLESGTSGAPIIQKELGTIGEQWALVLLGGGGGGGGGDADYKVAKVTAEIGAASDDDPANWGTGTGQPYDFTLGEVDSGADPITLYSMFPEVIVENSWVKYKRVYVGGSIAAYVDLVENAWCYEYPWRA